MNTIGSADVAGARSLFLQFSRVPASVPLRQIAGGNPEMVKLLDLHDALRARVRDASQIDAPVLADAIQAAGLSLADVSGKMNTCPLGSGKPKLPQG